MPVGKLAALRPGGRAAVFADAMAAPSVPTNFFGLFLDFLDFLLRVGGPTPQGLGVAYPHIVPTSP